VSSGSNAKFKADAPTDRGALAGIVKLMLRPSTALVLQSSDIQHDQADANTRLRASQRTRKSLLLGNTLGLIGCVFMLIGLKTDPALIIVGSVVFIGGTAVGVRGLLSVKRESSTCNPSKFSSIQCHESLAQDQSEIRAVGSSTRTPPPRNWGH
jgi:hypothetical protein